MADMSGDPVEDAIRACAIKHALNTRPDHGESLMARAVLIASYLREGHDMASRAMKEASGITDKQTAVLRRVKWAANATKRGRLLALVAERDARIVRLCLGDDTETSFDFDADAFVERILRALT